MSPELKYILCVTSQIYKIFYCMVVQTVEINPFENYILSTVKLKSNVSVI